MKLALVCAEDEIPGLCYLSSFLKHRGHEVYLVFEPKQFDRAYLRLKFLARLFSREKINLRKIGSIKPDMIGFSCTTAHYQWAISFAHKVKNVFPEIPVIFGGVHPTLVPEVVIQESCVDYLCVGEGEEAMIQLLESIKKGNTVHAIGNIWYKKDKTVVRNPLRRLNEDIDKLPFMDKALFEKDLPKSYREYCYYFTGRGCPFTCTFCGNEQMKKIFQGQGRYVRRMSVKRTIDELAFIKQTFESKHILFEDDIFTVDLPWLREFIPLYKEKIGLPFTCFIHPQFLSEESIALLKDGGCELVWFGIQSASERIRSRVFGRHETNDQIVKAADLCHKYKVRFMVDQLLNVPYESEGEILEAIALYNRIRPAMINCYNLLYFPKSKIIDIAVESGALKSADIEIINRGESVVYQTGDIGSKRKDFYNQYALLLSSIPLFSRDFVATIEKSVKWRRFFASVPLLCIPLVKVVLNFRIGRGFLPLSILRMEMFFTAKLIKDTLRPVFSYQGKNSGKPVFL